jgi:hypothetical protein
MEPTPAAEPFAGVGEERWGWCSSTQRRNPWPEGRPQGWRFGVHAIRTLRGQACGVESKFHTDTSVPRMR